MLSGHIQCRRQDGASDKEEHEPGPCLEGRLGLGYPAWPAQLALPPPLTKHIGGHPKQGVEHVMYLTVPLDHIG